MELLDIIETSENRIVAIPAIDALKSSSHVGNNDERELSIKKTDTLTYQQKMALAYDCLKKWSIVDVSRYPGLWNKDTQALELVDSITLRVEELESQVDLNNNPVHDLKELF